jgi:hypothetical protein
LSISCTTRHSGSTAGVGRQTAVTVLVDFDHDRHSGSTAGTGHRSPAVTVLVDSCTTRHSGSTAGTGHRTAAVTVLVDFVHDPSFRIRGRYRPPDCRGDGSCRFRAQPVIPDPRQEPAARPLRRTSAMTRASAESPGNQALTDPPAQRPRASGESLSPGKRTRVESAQGHPSGAAPTGTLTPHQPPPSPSSPAARSTGATVANGAAPAPQPHRIESLFGPSGAPRNAQAWAILATPRKVVFPQPRSARSAPRPPYVSPIRETPRSRSPRSR